MAISMLKPGGTCIQAGLGKSMTNIPLFLVTAKELTIKEHTYYEFADRSAKHTMSTTVQKPYVNHVITSTGGIGRANLIEFYCQSFVFSNPDHTGMDLVSCTIGIDRIVDEFVFSFRHDREIPWM
ncbi:hypothetical protein F5Y16DRAFT_300828 [Xylariaceae sp. FL0255]|nr:hypothetical protein F5Y16DRAFT_300828 [Xylariaceae sp. FL0255]